MVNPTERAVNGSDTIRLRRLRSFLEHVHLRLQVVLCRPSPVLMVAALIGTACPSQSEEGAVRVYLRVGACRVVLWAESIHIDGRKNRSVLVSMVPGVRIVDAHNGSQGHVVGLHLPILA